jgi:hypothetical protein
MLRSFWNCMREVKDRSWQFKQRTGNRMSSNRNRYAGRKRKREVRNSDEPQKRQYSVIGPPDMDEISKDTALQRGETLFSAEYLRIE